MTTKLFVGNLPYNTTEEELRTLFAQAGEVASVAVIKDRDTGAPKGFGFVEMGSPNDAQKAIHMFNDFQLGDRPLKVNPARPREERGPGGGGNFGGGYGGGRVNHKRRGGNTRRNY